MPYIVPQMPLTVFIWRGPPAYPPVGLPVVVTVCNLTPGRRVMLPSQVPASVMEALLPALTDVRAADPLTGNDVVEIPATSGRYYKVVGVDDIGKGFPNEHRIAWIEAHPIAWPYPIP